VLGSVGAIGVLESGVRGRGAGGSTLRIGLVVTGAVGTTWGVCRGTLVFDNTEPFIDPRCFKQVDWSEFYP
jgi:hypothetical protein